MNQSNEKTNLFDAPKNDKGESGESEEFDDLEYEWQCNNCCDYVVKAKLYERKSDDTIIGNVCCHCIQKCKECNESYILQYGHYYDHDDFHFNDYFCSKTCFSFWRIIKTGDENDKWYDDGYSGYNTYNYSVERKE